MTETALKHPGSAMVIMIVNMEMMNWTVSNLTSGKKRNRWKMNNCQGNIREFVTWEKSVIVTELSLIFLSVVNVFCQILRNCYPWFFVKGQKLLFYIWWVFFHQFVTYLKHPWLHVQYCSYYRLPTCPGKPGKQQIHFSRSWKCSWILQNQEMSWKIILPVRKSLQL